MQECHDETPLTLLRITKVDMLNIGTLFPEPLHMHELTVI